jgi:hypothetical protein
VTDCNIKNQRKATRTYTGQQRGFELAILDIPKNATLVDGTVSSETCPYGNHLRCTNRTVLAGSSTVGGLNGPLERRRVSRGERLQNTSRVVIGPGEDSNDIEYYTFDRLAASAEHLDLSRMSQNDSEPARA